MPRTKAGKALLARLWPDEWSPESVEEAAAIIAAIEREARMPIQRRRGERLLVLKAEAVAAERERITAALRKQPTPPRLYALSAWDLDCVLAIVNPEAEP